MAEADQSKKTYELTILITSELSEFDAAKVGEKIRSSIASKGGEVIRISDWGKKKLSYSIKGNEYGFYQTMIFHAPAEAIAPLARELELAPEILRYITISVEKEGVTIDQLFSPEKEEQMISSSVKEKLAPTPLKPKPAAEEPAPQPEVTISQEEIDQKIEEALKADLE